MSDKNFKVKNGLDANGAVTITQPNTSTVPLTILANTLATGPNLLEVKRPDGTVRLSIGNDGAFSAQNLVAYNARFYSAQTDSSGLIIRGLPSQTADLQQWRDINETVLASVSASGSITAVDLTLSGNLTVNGTTTNLNSTNLVIEDKNIIIADVATPTDTTADGAGITIKGATDKTFNWVNSTKSFTSSEPLIINNSSTTTIPLIVKGYSFSQTADLQQWQNSGGTVKASIDTYGNAGFGGVGANSTQGLYVKTNSNPAVIGIVVQGASSQTANLTEWQNNSGTVIARVTNAGDIVGQSLTTNWGISQIAANSAVIGLIVKAASSQTADLQQWQDSSGNILSRIGNNGTFFWGGNSYLSASLGTALIGNNYASDVALKIKGANSQTADLQQWQDSSGNILSGITSSGAFYAGATSGNTRILTDGRLFVIATVGSGSQAAFIQTQVASHIGLIVKGAASQTADLQQWQDSSGNILGRFHPTAGLLLSAIANTNGGAAPYLNINTTSFDLFTNTATNKGLVIKAASGQSANLMEFQNSSGTALTYFNSSGGLTATEGVMSTLYSGGKMTTGTLGYFNATTFSPSVIPIVVRGTTSQTADLQQWQNSAGTVLTSINANGRITLSDGLLSANGLTGISSAGELATGFTYVHLGTASTFATAASTSFGGLINIGSGGNASFIPLVIRGAASQTANLQEWQDSAGTVLAKIDASGNISIGSGISTSGSVLSTTGLYSAYAVGIGLSRATGNANLAVSTGSTTNVGILVRGVASQTADLQQWQNSAGNAMALVNSSGAIITGDIIRATNGGIFGGTTQLSTALTVYAQTAGQIGQIIRGAASQTANLQEWQDSVGTVLARVNANGYFSSGIFDASSNLFAGYQILGGRNVYNMGASAAMGMVNWNTGLHTLQLRNVSSQTGDSLRIENSSGTAITKIDVYGNLISSGIVVTPSLGTFANATVQFKGTSSSNPILALQPNSGSSTGDALTYYNAAGSAVLAKLDYLGNFSAVSKSFDIPHPTKENMRLRYASLEGPENGVYIRGTVESNIIELPDYWIGLVHEDSITVSLTAVGSAQNIYVEKIEDNKVYIGGELKKAFFTIYGERKDIDNLTVEY